MKKEILLSLGDNDLKGLSEVLGSDSAMKILEELALEDLSVSEIARRLSMKINTVDYNVRKLLGTGLIEKVNHWWSTKGRKMHVYRASNKRIIISPNKKSLNKVLFGWSILGLIAIWWKGWSFQKSQDVISTVSDGIFQGVPKMESLAVNAGLSDSVLKISGEISFWKSIGGLEWFLFGVWFSVLIFFIYSIISIKFSKRGAIKK